MASHCLQIAAMTPRWHALCREFEGLIVLQSGVCASLITFFIAHTSPTHFLLSCTHPSTRTGLGEFQLGEVLGRGAFGVVYKGLNMTTGEFVAIKRLGKPRRPPLCS